MMTIKLTGGRFTDRGTPLGRSTCEVSTKGRVQVRVQARERTEWAHASISSAGASSPSGASSATAAGAGGSSSLGMSPEKKSLIFLPMSPIGLSSAIMTVGTTGETAATRRTAGACTPGVNASADEKAAAITSRRKNGIGGTQRSREVTEAARGQL